MNKECHYIVCGFGRSGSTMFHHMLATTVQRVRFYETEKPALKVRNDPNPKLTKRPRDCFLRSEIEKHCHNPVFVYTYRDLRDILCSVHANSEGHYKFDWDKGLGTGRSSDGRGFLTGKDTEGVLDYCRELKRREGDVWVKYEELVQAPNVVQQEIARKLGFEMKGRFSDFHRHNLPERYVHPLNGVRPVEKSRIGNWKNHPERIKQQFTECPELFDWLIYFGYEKDGSWYERLYE